jgi:hypothetical protein
MTESESFVVYAHGHNGDFPFMEPWTVVATLAEAKRTAERVMRKDRFSNLLADGTPTITWMEVFGPGIEESLGFEGEGDNLRWEGA